MKRREFLVSVALVPVVTAIPTGASSTVFETTKRPELEEAANFRCNATVLGTSNARWQSGYLIDLYKRVGLLLENRAGWDMFGVGQSVAFGNKAFLDDLMEARPIPNIYLGTYAFDMTWQPSIKDRENAVYAAMRSNSPLVMLESLNRQEPLVPNTLLPKLFMSGIHVAGALTAPTVEELFEKVGPSLGIATDDLDRTMWALAPRSGSAQVQVFFDGKDLTNEYGDWLADTFGQPS
jgi:hypothetical protein